MPVSHSLLLGAANSSYAYSRNMLRTFSTTTCLLLPAHSAP